MPLGPPCLFLSLPWLSAASPWAGFVGTFLSSWLTLVASLPRSLSLFLSLGCCAPHRVPLVVWWARSQTDVSVAWAMGPSRGEQHTHPSEVSLRQRVPVLVAAQPGAWPVVGRELSACMGQVWSVGPPRGSWCCALAAGALGSVLPAALALHHQGGSTAAPPFLWLVGGLDLWRERKVCHKQRMLSGEAGTEQRLELLNASPQRPKHPLFVPAGF